MQELVTDAGVAQQRRSIMQQHPAFASHRLASSMEQVIVYDASEGAARAAAAARIKANGALAVGGPFDVPGGGVDGVDASSKRGEMTAHQFGYSNTAEAFVAVQVCSCSS